MRSLIGLDTAGTDLKEKVQGENVPARQEEDCEHYTCVWSLLGANPNK